uniref:FA complementation group E n=1 Tax=Stegastes partitus TaxID=144197 RepID=A0A3B5A604_9TELE
MDKVAMFLCRFDGQSRLLVRSLLSGGSGAHTALAVFRKQQRANPDTSLGNLLETLCRHEVSRPEADTDKPLVCLFPALFKQNLLSFMCLVHSALPVNAAHRLLKCLSQDSHPNPWITALVRQLERNLGTHRKQPLYSSQCSQRLTELSQRLAGSGETRGWAECFSSDTVRFESQNVVDLPELGTQRKRKSSLINLESDGEEMEQQSKRMKICENEQVDAEEQSVKMETPGGSESDAPAEASAPASEYTAASIKVEVLCNMLSLSSLPEQTLPKLCSSILSLSPDLSYSTAATLIKSLLLEKVLSLSEPASRCLVTAVTSLCSQYPRPMCHALIGPVLEETNIGPPQAELLNRLIEGCLDSHYRLLVMTFKIPWSEAVLSIIHSLLDSKPVLNEELFTQFTEQLVSQGPQFTKSVKFAKMMLTVLTKYSSNVTATHKHSLSGSLMLNGTFLKKPLQAALKRITHT